MLFELLFFSLVLAEGDFGPNFRSFVQLPPSQRTASCEAVAASGLFDILHPSFHGPITDFVNGKNVTTNKTLVGREICSYFSSDPEEALSLIQTPQQAIVSCCVEEGIFETSIFDQYPIPTVTLPGVLSNASCLCQNEKITKLYLQNGLHLPQMKVNLSLLTAFPDLQDLIIHNSTLWSSDNQKVKLSQNLSSLTLSYCSFDRQGPIIDYLDLINLPNFNSLRVMSHSSCVFSTRTKFNPNLSFLYVEGDADTYTRDGECSYDAQFPILPPGLKFLTLTGIKRNGNITMLSNLPQATTIIIKGNPHMWGELPDIYKEGCPLTHLDISGNINGALLGRRFPQSLKHCTQLQYLNLYFNQMTGEFPDFPNLRFADISYNSFTSFKQLNFSSMVSLY